MEGILFFWLSWLLWVITTFLMPKTKIRMWLAIVVLASIMTSSWHLIMGQYVIKITSIILIFFSAISLSVYTDKRMQNITGAIGVCFGYSGILMWESLSPVWVIFPRIILLSILAYAVISLIAKSYIERISIWLLGSMTGEIVYSVILSAYGIVEPIGEYNYLDLALMVCMLVIVGHAIQAYLERFEKFVQRVTAKKARWNNE